MQTPTTSDNPSPCHCLVVAWRALFHRDPVDRASRVARSSRSALSFVGVVAQATSTTAHSKARRPRPLTVADCPRSASFTRANRNDGLARALSMTASPSPLTAALPDA